MDRTRGGSPCSVSFHNRAANTQELGEIYQVCEPWVLFPGRGALSTSLSDYLIGQRIPTRLWTDFVDTDYVTDYHSCIKYKLKLL